MSYGPLLCESLLYQINIVSACSICIYSQAHCGVLVKCSQLSIGGGGHDIFLLSGGVGGYAEKVLDPWLAFPILYPPPTSHN